MTTKTLTLLFNILGNNNAIIFTICVGTSGPGGPSTPTAKPKIQIAGGQSSSFVNKMETNETAKRKREDDDYDVP